MYLPPSILTIVLFFDMTDAVYIGSATFQRKLVIIGEIVMKWQPFFEIKNGGIAILNPDNCPNFRQNRRILTIHGIRNILTHFGEDWSNSKEMATVFRSSSWRQSSYYLLATVLVFDIT